jgi:adenosylcobinamide-phosphate synthase
MDLSFFLPKSFSEFSLILLSSVIVDWIYPEHKGIMYYIHPVHTSYELALLLNRKLPKNKLSGSLIWISVASLHIAMYGSALYFLRLVSDIAWIAFSVYILKVSISQRLLFSYVKRTSKCLSQGDLRCARAITSHIVRRDTSSLDEGHIASASIESLFESMVDGFISPIFFYLILGPLGALLQRIANTMDSALGYKDEEFREKGWFSAKMDTILNFLPARIASLITLLLCPCIDGSIEDGWSVFAEYRNSTESVNAGNPMSASSGCLKVRLEKIGHYTIGREFPFPSSEDLERALKLAICESLAYLIIVLLISSSFYFLSS